jgi:hypothetical protein
MANKKWCGIKPRALIAKLRVDEARRAKWAASSATDILADANAALMAASIYDAQSPTPGAIWMTHSAYMIMTGHVFVKMGRRGGKWVKTEDVPCL